MSVNGVMNKVYLNISQNSFYTADQGRRKV
jgi:hypothetical protein